MVDAREYHDRTTHTVEEIRNSDFRLDRDNMPRPYKIYEDLPKVDAGADRDPPDTPALAAIAQPDPDPGVDETEPEPPTVGTLCRYATGVTKTLERQGQQVRFRAAACTGKLYHVDLYAVVGDCADLDPGVYHYDPDGDAFDRLRDGDYRGVLAAATGDFSDPSDADRTAVTDAPVTFVATSTWWRNAWKYRERTYRHAFWDSGTILANLLAVAHGQGHRAEIVAGFADGPVVDLLGLDPDDEAPLELVAVGSGDPVADSDREKADSGPSAVEPIDPDERPLSPDPVDYPLIADAWRQSTLDDGEAVRGWRERFEGQSLGTHGVGDGELIDLDPVDAETASARPIGTTIERRGSLREYSHESISDRKFATVLDRALGGIPVDCPADGSRLIDCYCLVHAVDGIPQGAYQYHPGETALERLGETDRETAGQLALGQSVVGDAAANVYLMADVDAIVEAVGNRGYRLAQLAGGIGLGRLYLATYAHRTLGGRGFTFYDDQVTDHLSPRAAEQTPMTLFAFGKPLA